MTDTSIGVTVLQASQNQKEVTINNAFYLMSALLKKGVISQGDNTPPGSPASGDVYILGSSPTGAWASQSKKIAHYIGGWKFITPTEGMFLWVNDENKFYVFDGTDWQDYQTVITALQNLSMLGINTTADATNKFAVKSVASLFDNIGGDHQQKINKFDDASKASQIYQNNYSGRAEIGLLGNDDFTFKVSPDGSTWYDAIVLDKDDGTSLRKMASGTVASAATCNLASVGTQKITITGTTTITSFGTSANDYRLIRFTGILTLTHNATSLILPGGTNITTAVGDCAIVTSDSSGNWTVRHYQRADGYANKDRLPKLRISGGDLPLPTLDMVAFPDAFGFSLLPCQRTTVGYRYNKFGILEKVGIGLWRFDYDPTTLEFLGCLFETTTTNICLYSQELSNAAWTKAGTTITDNAFTAPDNTATMDKIVEDSGTSEHKISQTMTGTVSARTSVSLWATPSGRSYVKIRLSDNAAATNYFEAVFNVTTGVVTSTAINGNGSAVVAKIQYCIATGTYRCIVSGTANTSGTTFLLEIFTSSDGTTFNYLGDGASGIGVWGVQVERMAGATQTSLSTLSAGAFSYQPTTGASATSGSDNPNIISTIANFYNSKAFTVFVEALGLFIDTDHRPLGINNGTQNEQIDILFTTSGIQTRIRVGGSNIYSQVGSYAASGFNKVALCGRAGRQIAAVNEVLITGGSSSSHPTGISQLEVGEVVNSGNFNGWIKRLSLWGIDLTDAELLFLTKA